MNAWKIVTKNWEETFVVATNAENAIREAKKHFRNYEKEYGFVLKPEVKEIVRVRLVGFVQNI